MTKKPDPREAAVALAYRAGQSAPQVVAKGRGLVAESIIRKARDHGIYVHESAELVSLLMQVDLDQHIPPQLYRAVAELLAWLYKLEAGAALSFPYKALPSPSASTGGTEALLLDKPGTLPDKPVNR
ncbi:flagellar biosynthetic protein FlhB [Nitrosospira sp. NpAV]|nr:flagellar biosynthetic protein FlhB [Nitrosospira sp. NpAV]